MLTDHYRHLEWKAAASSRDRQALQEYGAFLLDLREWTWFVTVTFDGAWPPSRGWALTRLQEFLQELEAAAGGYISWVIADGFGRLSRRYHCHLLVAQVENLSIECWQAKATARFGKTEIALFYPELGGAHYIAKNSLSRNGDLHFGGAGFLPERLEKIATRTRRWTGE